MSNGKKLKEVEKCLGGGIRTAKILNVICNRI